MQNSVAFQALNQQILSQRLMHADEVANQIHNGSLQVLCKDPVNSENILKQRWGILCTSRLLLFKPKAVALSGYEKQLALAVYPIINTEFEILPNSSTKSHLTALQLTFKDTTCCQNGSGNMLFQEKEFRVTKLIYCESYSEAEIWLEKLQQAQYNLRAMVTSPAKSEQFSQPSQLEHQSQLNFVQKGLAQLQEYFSCTRGICCDGNSFRTSLHEIQVPNTFNQFNSLFPPQFSSFESDVVGAPDEFTFRPKQAPIFNNQSDQFQRVHQMTQGQMMVVNKDVEMITRVSMCLYSRTDKELQSEGEELRSQNKQLESEDLNSYDKCLSSGSKMISQTQDLISLIGHIFIQEYDPLKVQKLCRERESNPSFDVNQDEMNIQTSAPQRIFTLLRAFVQSEKQSNLNYGIQKDKFFEKLDSPCPLSKTQLIFSIHEVEDILVAYAEDTIMRVLADIKRQKNTNKRNQFKLRKSYQISVNLLVNDIQNFANLYKAFRDEHFKYFNLSPDQSISPETGKVSQNQNPKSDSDVYVPVVPALSSAFYQLQLIDEFRVTGKEETLREFVDEATVNFNSKLITQLSSHKTQNQNENLPSMSAKKTTGKPLRQSKSQSQNRSQFKHLR